MIAKLLLLAVTLCAVSGNTVSRQGNLNSYYLYTQANQNNPIPLVPSEFEAGITTTEAGGAGEEVAVPELASGVQTIFIVHGHGADWQSSLNPTVKNAFLLRGEEINVIVVDWSAYSKLSYSAAVTAVPSVGDSIGEFIGILVENSRIVLSDVHLIGFNLGAHVVGFAGRNRNGQVARITGLDPSGSQWGSNRPRLTTSDAVYVEVIHTDGGGLGSSNGIGTAIGDVDFFVNGGKNQPGCATHACSHDRAFDLFAASLVRDGPLNGYPCRTNLQLTLNKCTGFPVPLGGVVLDKLHTPGIYRVNTNRSFPF